jgi:hypothetical protein
VLIVLALVATVAVQEEPSEPKTTKKAITVEKLTALRHDYRQKLDLAGLTLRQYLRDGNKKPFEEAMAALQKVEMEMDGTPVEGTGVVAGMKEMNYRRGAERKAKKIMMVDIQCGKDGLNCVVVDLKDPILRQLKRGTKVNLKGVYYASNVVDYCKFTLAK